MMPLRAPGEERPCDRCTHRPHAFRGECACDCHAIARKNMEIAAAAFADAPHPLRDAALAALLDALDGIELSAAERRTLTWLADHGESAHRLAGVIRRARGAA